MDEKENKEEQLDELQEAQQPIDNADETGEATEQEQESAVSEHPNRDIYSQMFSEDNPDVDFEDKEARYGRMNEERQRYRSYRDNGKKLSEVFDRNPFTAKMFMDLRENPDQNPITWMADNGIDIAEVMQNPDYAKEVSDRIAKYQENQLKGQEEARQREDNLQNSAHELQGLQEEFGLDDEQCGEIWRQLFEDVLDPALHGQISADTWRMLIKARNYDDDISSAREEAAMQARNEKIQNKLKSNETEVPPTLGQGSGGSTAPKKPKRSSFFDDLRD